MKYFIIVGEASGDLHAAHLMRALRREDPEATFRFYGGDLMSAVGGVRLKHFKEMAYMGIIPVLLHLPTILSNMRACKQAIKRWRPDVVILVDYPGFNLSIAAYVHRHRLCPVFYYISPKIWAWREGRIRQIRRYVDRLYSILPFEVDFYEHKHHYPITYVGNPTLDEVMEYQTAHGRPQPDPAVLALLPGSRRQEIADNLSRMLQVGARMAGERALSLHIAMAPNIPAAFYDRLIQTSGVPADSVQLHAAGRNYDVLAHAGTALVTSGTATLETALFGVPQVVCYYIRCGFFVRLLRKLFLRVPYISLVNLIAGREVVPEMVADDMNVSLVSQKLAEILPGGPRRAEMLAGYAELRARMGAPGAAKRAAKAMVEALKQKE